MHFVDSSHLAAALLDASHISLQELTMTPTEGLQGLMKTQREHWSMLDPMPYMQNLRTITLRIWDGYSNDSTWPCLDDAVEILEVSSADLVAYLNIEFTSPALAELSDDLPGVLDHPSLRRFERSVAGFTACQTTVSIFPKRRRGNRHVFWTPVLARAFPLLNLPGISEEPSQ